MTLSLKQAFTQSAMDQIIPDWRVFLPDDVDKLVSEVISHISPEKKVNVENLQILLKERYLDWYESRDRATHVTGLSVPHTSTGFVAKTDLETFDLVQIPYEAERRLGLVFQEGVEKYGRGNWRSGVRDRAYQLERANHALKHLKIYLHYLEFGEDLGVPGEDNLAKVAWFCATQMEIERMEKMK